MRITKRMEYKYQISYADYHMLKPLLETMLHKDRHCVDGAYSIFSIYLDDVYDSGAMDKAFGNQYHKKYRLRYYRDPSEMKLELKEKEGNDTTKTSTVVPPALAKAIINNDLDTLEQHFDDPLIRRYALDSLRYHYQPKTNILYHREAYVDDSENVRITFDHAIQAAPFLEDEDMVYQDVMHQSHLILEVKYEHYLPKEVKNLFHKSKLTLLSVSKYFLGYHQITP